MKIIYVVPRLNDNGGIQEFAKFAQSSLIKVFNVKLIDWRGSLSNVQKLILYLLPTSLGSLLFNRWNRSDYGQIKSKDIVHYWHINTAVSLKDSYDIVSCHGHEILESSVAKYYKKHFMYVLKNTKVIVASSKYTRNYLVEHYNINAKKITVITPGIDINKYRYSPKKTDDKIIIGTLSRFVDRKNIPNIIKALEILKKDRELNFTYYLAGDGPSRKRIMRALNKSNITYKYFGKISEEDKLNKFYPALNVFVLPPLETLRDVEGFGIVFLEANASGVPVVASNTGGVSDAVKVGASGLFADPESPEDIANKIYSILFNTKDWRISSRSWAEKFSKEKKSKEFEKIYKSDRK